MKFAMHLLLSLLLSPFWLAGFALGFVGRPAWEGLIRGFYLLLIIQECQTRKVAHKRYTEILTEEEEKLATLKQQASQ